MRSRVLMPTRNYIIPIALILLCAFGFQYSFAEEEFVSDELIVKIKPGADAAAVEEDLEAEGNAIIDTIPELGIVVLRLPPNVPVSSAEAVIAEVPDVEYVEKNYIVYADLTPNDPGYGNQSGYFNRIDAPQAWDNITGDPDVVIAVLDTGVRSTHQDIGKLVQGCNTTGSFSETNCGSDSGDVHGHGSGVAGTAAALTNNGTGVAGVCWGCSVMPVKVLGDTGSGSTTDVIQGIIYAANYAINNQNERVIINMSFGRTCSGGITTSEQNAIDFAWNNNVLVTTSAGNTANSSTQCPANANNVIAVSATTNSDNLASFSSFGNDVDLAAPGVSIYNVRGVNNSAYTFWSGTSFSSPITAGIAGLVWSANPSLTNAEVDQMLRDTAEDIGDPFLFGDGRVNADLAVEAAIGGPPPTPPPPTPPPPTPTPPPPTPPPGGGATLTGLDPSIALTTNTITVTGAPQGATVRFQYSFTNGTKTIQSGVCAGLTLDFKRTKSFGTATADANGTAVKIVDLDASFAEKTIHIQARVETETCEITNKVVQNIQ